MQLLSPGFGDHIDNAAAVVPVLRVEVIGQNPELGDRIEIGNNGGAAVHQFLHVAAVDHETVGVFALPADRLVAGIQSARGAIATEAPAITIESGVWVDMGTMPGCRASRSVKLRPLSATAVIFLPVTTSPIWVLTVSS